VWTFINTKLLTNAFADWEYWSYFRDVWVEQIVEEDPHSEMTADHWKKALTETDCLFVLFTPMNLPVMEHEDFFVDKIFEHYYPRSK
jgi:hypothetical protein